MKLTKCPYCGKKVGYLSAFFMHNQGEYCCSRCKKESNVIIRKTLIIPFIIAVIFALLILFYFLTMTNRQNLWFMLFVAIPFIIFYLLTPGFVVLKPKKKFMDSLYDTEMVESPITEPDPTMAKTSKVIPTFVDDVILDDEEYKPTINKDVFDAIKKERKTITNTEGGTKAFSKYEEISSSEEKDKTMPVENLKEIKPKKKELSDTALLLQNIDSLIENDKKVEKEPEKIKIKEEKPKSKVKETKEAKKEKTESKEPVKEKEVKEEKEEEKIKPAEKEENKEKEIIKEEVTEKEEEKPKSKDYDLSLFE